MIGKIGGRRRFAVIGEVTGAGDEHPADRADAPGDEPGVGQLADAHGDIDAFIDEIDVSVEQQRGCGDAAMRAKERPDNRK